MLYSRRALLPKVRGNDEAYQNKLLNKAAFTKYRRENEITWDLSTVFRLLDLELENAYGRPVDWAKIVIPKSDPVTTLQRALRDAIEGDGPGGGIVWQTVISQTLPFIREWYRGLTVDDRKRFDRRYTSIFFAHAATQPWINAAKLHALMKAGLVGVRRLGLDYRFYRDEAQSCFRFDYKDAHGCFRSEAYPFVVNAQGQQMSLKSNPSELAQNLISAAQVNKESVMIDPDTHRLPALSTHDSGSKTVYAVGAMTRGQIIDVSMAHGICLSIKKVVNDLMDTLERRR